MTIRINQTPVEFSLQHETTMDDLTASLYAWAQGQGLAVVGLLADGKAVDGSTPLSSLNELDVEVVPAAERAASQADVIASYFELLAKAAGDPAVVRDLQSEYAGIRQAWSALVPHTPHWAGPLETLAGPWTSPPLVAKAAAEAAALVRLRERELRDPRAALAQTLAELDARASRLSDLGLLFQRGQDGEAFSAVLSFFTVLEDLGRQAGPALGAAGADPSGWEGFLGDLQPFLKETQQALVNQDYILLNDLLEYEVIPRLAEVGAQFPFLSNLDPA